MRKRSIFAIAVVGTIAVPVMVAWLYRTNIVTSFVDRELRARNVRAQYDITDIGLGSQRLSNVVVGDPANPDLTIRELEVGVALGIDGPRIATIQATGVRLRGRLVNNRLSFGAVDRLIPKDEGAPFSLPEMLLSLRDASARVDTRWGRIGIGANGHGYLPEGFVGRLALRSARLIEGGCIADDVHGALRIAMTDGQPLLSGPLGAQQMACEAGAMQIADVRLGIEARASPALDHWTARSRLRTGSATLALGRFAALSGEMHAAPRADSAVTAGWTISGHQASSRWASARAVVLAGEGYRFADGRTSGTGTIRATGARASTGTSDRLQAFASAGAGTPLAPLAQKLGAALAAAATGASATAHYRISLAPGRPVRAALGDIAIDTQSGGFVQLAGPDVLTWSSSARSTLSFDARFGGGGLPDGSLRLRSRAGDLSAYSGDLQIAAYRHGGAELALTPVRVSSNGNGHTRFATTARLSGPLPDGRIDGLRFALSGSAAPSGAISLDGGCQTIAWASISTGALAVDAGGVPLCASAGQPLLRFANNRLSGSAHIGTIALDGDSGGTTLGIEASGGVVDLGAQSFALNGVKIRLGGAGDDTNLSFDHIDGQAAPTGFGGNVSGATGSLANVPFLFGGSAGQWVWRDSELLLAARMTVTDAQADARFQPLRSDDAQISYRAGHIRVTGSLAEPRSNTRVANVTIGHNFDGGVGSADFTVPGISFQRGGIQPVMLSRLSLGVIADAVGTVRGRGQINWAAGDVASSGQFSTDSLDLSAAFGPVQRMSGTISFDDLIGLTTPAGQRVLLGSVNPGIEVLDGVVDYQLLPDRQVRVESGRWPLAGGQLLLRPTVLDFDIARPRNLTFDVTGIDAGLFLSRFEFDNISATGVFDGTIPTVFDQNGGRITGGLLQSQAGGTLSYVGELTYNDLGYFGNLAFGALRSLKYDRLSIGMNGRIDGDMVTDVGFAGLSQGQGADNNILTRAIRRLPFVFQIRINAPFRSLLSTARGLYDPTLLIEQQLPTLLQRQREADRQTVANEPVGDDPVQPVLSEDDP